MLLNFKIKMRRLGFLSPPNDNKFVTFYKDCPIKVPGKGTYQRWFLIKNSFVILVGGPLYGGAFIIGWWGFIRCLGLYNRCGVCGDGGDNLAY